MVEMAGLQPATSRLQGGHSGKLSYIPNDWCRWRPASAHSNFRRRDRLPRAQGSEFPRRLSGDCGLVSARGFFDEVRSQPVWYSYLAGFRDVEAESNGRGQRHELMKLARCHYALSRSCWCTTQVSSLALRFFKPALSPDQLEVLGEVGAT